MKKLLIIGASVLQLPAIKRAKELGFYVGVVDYNPKAIGIPFADEYFNVSTNDQAGVTEAAKAFAPNGIMTLATDMPMRSIAAASAELGLPGIDMSTAIKATDKGEMIKAFAAAGVEHPWYFILRSPDELDSVIGEITFPCISKPTDNSGSRGVMLIANESELRDAVAYSSENGRSGGVIVEEYMKGSEVSVEIMVLDGTPHVLNVTDKLTTGAPHFVEMGHSQPSSLAHNDVERIKDLASRAVLAVGIKNGPAHVEIMLTEQGPKMVELGARMGGDCITTHLVPLSTGIDMIEATMRIACGESPDINPKFERGSAIRYFKVPAGIIKSISGVDEAMRIPGIREISFTKQVGDTVGDVGSSTDRVGFVIADGATAAEAVSACEEALNKVKIVVAKKEKKILILGGFPQMIEVVMTARKMGIYTIVTDKEPTSPAKRFSNEALNISTDRIDELEQFCKNERVDGIFCGFEDFNIHIAEELTRRLEIPFYATKKQIDTVTNKRKFKEKCREYGVPIIEQYSLDEAISLKAFPYIIKPVDSYGSRGITVANSIDELISGYKKAVDTSASRNAIIEKFVDNDHGVELFYTAVNGNLHLTVTADRYTVRSSESTVPIPVAEVFPSCHRDEIVAKLDGNIRKMLEGMGIKNGLILIQALYDSKGDYFVYEMAYRFTGEQHYRLVEKQHGISLSEMMLADAVGEDISEFDNSFLDDTAFIKPAINLSVILKPGVIAEINGLDEVLKIDEVISYNITHSKGDAVSPSGDYSQIFLRVNMVAESYDALRAAVRHVAEILSVKSTDGSDMILSRFELSVKGYQ